MIGLMFFIGMLALPKDDIDVKLKNFGFYQYSTIQRMQIIGVVFACIIFLWPILVYRNVLNFIDKDIEK